MGEKYCTTLSGAPRRNFCAVVTVGTHVTCDIFDFEKKLKKKVPHLSGALSGKFSAVKVVEKKSTTLSGAPSGNFSSVKVVEKKAPL